MVELEHRELLGVGHGIFHQRAGDQLAVVVVDSAFDHCLAEALDDAALELAGDDEWVDNVADIIDRNVADQLRLSGDAVDLDDVMSRTVRLLVPSSIAQVLFDPLLERFLKQHPKVRLELSEGLWGDAASRLLSGAVDIAVMGGARKSEYIDLEPLASEQMILVGRASDPVVSNKSIPVTALAGLPLLMPAMTLERLRQFAPDLTQKLDVSVYVESAPAIRALAASGWGYAVVPQSVLLGRIERRSIKGVPIRGFETLRQIGMLRGRPISRAMQELTAALRAEPVEILAQRSAFLRKMKAVRNSPAATINKPIPIMPKSGSFLTCSS